MLVTHVFLLTFTASRVQAFNFDDLAGIGAAVAAQQRLSLTVESNSGTATDTNSLVAFTSLVGNKSQKRQNQRIKPGLVVIEASPVSGADSSLRK